MVEYLESVLRTGFDTSGVYCSPQKHLTLLCANERWAVIIRNTRSWPKAWYVLPVKVKWPHQWVLSLKWGAMKSRFFTISSLRSPLSIPSVVVTTSTSANPQQSEGTHLLVARLVSLLPDVQADCAEQRPCRRRRTRSVLIIKSVQ